MAVDLKMAAQRFAQHFSRPAEVIARAPGRVNLIGEHTDYNEGFVLPSTVDFDVAVVCAPRTDRKIHLYSLDYQQSAEVDLDAPGFDQMYLWVKYMAGCADLLIRNGHAIGGADMLVTGDVPRGSGLSSSAAIEMATLTAFEALNGLAFDPVEKIKMGQKVEHNYVGVPCGIMDQFISGLGGRDSALFIDCRTLEYRHVPLRLDGVKIVICDTQRKRSLAASAYAQRCRECAEGVRLLSDLLGRPLTALRDVSLDELRQHEASLPSPVRERCRHVVSENERVLAAVAALEANDLEAMGRLMNGSHASLRDDYAVSCEELDEICELGNGLDGELGSRMTGAGFGGCTVHLVRASAVAAFLDLLTEKYYRPRNLEPTVYICAASPGAGRRDVP